MKEFRGTYAVTITPMNQDQELDENGLKENIEWYIDEGIAGICCCGSTGEFVSLSRRERQRIAQITVEQARGRVPVLVGTSSETTKETIEYTRYAREAGADGVLIVSSYYYKPTENELFEHFRRISEAVDIPIMLYNNPWTSGVDIKSDLITKICSLKNINYVKESSGDIRRVRDILRLSDNRVGVFCGADDLSFESLILGACGWISVCANIIPGMSQKLFDLIQEKRVDEALTLYQSMLQLLDLIESSGKYVQVVKAALNKMGHHAGPSRLPRLPLDKGEDATLDRILKELGLI